MVARAFGITVPNRLPVMRSYPVQDLIKLVELAEEIKHFDSAWVGDNLLTKPRLDSVTLLSALAVKTKRLKLGTACMASFPLRDPVILAIEWATLDILSSGRTILGVCIGGAVSGGEISPEKEFATFGRSLKDRVGLVVEGVELLRRLWSGEVVTYNGKHYRVEGIKLDVLPLQKPLPIWLAVTPRPEGAEKTLRRVARLFDGWMTTKLSPMSFELNWEMIKKYAAEYGRRIEENVLYYNININSDRERAFKEAKGFLDEYYMMDFSREGVDIWTAYGTPDDCIKRLEEYFYAGVKRITLRFCSYDQFEQLRRFEREVLPSF